jgi:hypothetical protein
MESSVAACSVALAFTFVSQVFLKMVSANGTQEVPMNMNISEGIVVASVLQVIVATGTTAIAGLLAT